MQALVSRKEFLLTLMAGIALPQQNSPKKPTASGNAPTAALYRRTAVAVQKNLDEQILHLWYPRAVDKQHGGFYQSFGEDWNRFGPNTKSLVYQSRLTWLASAVAQQFPDRADEFGRYARHGLAFLTDHLWDSKYGGMYWGLSEEGEAVAGGQKHAYGTAFSIYALSACYRATRDPQALSQAKKIFQWLDSHAHDGKNAGYYEALSRDGKPILEGNGGDFIGTTYGRKSMNTHIHLLEALSELFTVWPDPLVKVRLSELYAIVRDHIATDEGRLEMFFTPDWKPVGKEDSYGHDIETAYLLEEAADVLGQESDPRLRKRTRQIVDHTIEFGWDETNGGFYDSGPTHQPASRKMKIWWVQAEAVNSLLLMHRHHGKQTLRYWDLFQKQWKFIQTHQVDAKYKGWYGTVSPEGAPYPRAPKSEDWTDPYHQGRAMLNVLRTLNALAAKQG